MKYAQTLKGKFISRPNRFIAYVEIGGEEKVCHVKNTGRCKELLIPGATVVLEKSDKPERKTEYDLISVYKGDKLINMDSQAPNKVFGEWAAESGFFGEAPFIKPECRYGASRFDFYVEAEGRRIFVEVKGVTLERDGIILFPDAPTERGVKHINELADAVKNGYEAYVFFICQMKDCRFFTPNRETHPQFADALKTAAEKGVQVRCVNCDLSEDTLTIDGFVEVRL
ncbi:MAG: DNA/RNA nuclease SfsA [Clostridia bacterium]|nr:DNA/RNA nuclease SfsA [Clostridia bacterium]